MTEDRALFSMPMYFEGKKTIHPRHSTEALQKGHKNLTISTTMSSRDSVSSKSIGSSYSSRSSNVPQSASDTTKSTAPSPAVEFRDTTNAANFTPISTQDVMIFTYGYRGYSDPLSIPGGFETISWDVEKIEETVTSQFLKEKIPTAKGKERLDVPLGFGDGLTDETYAEWVVQKAKRLFLLLLEFGMPEKIFDVVDLSWDDDDLPLEPTTIHRLKLRENYDRALENKFYKRQFSYILKEFRYKSHIEFQEEDEVPLVVSYRQKTPGFSFPQDDRVHRPRHKDLLMYRRKVILGPGPDKIMEHDFLPEVDTLRNLRHPHIVDVQATYTYLDEGYLLTTPVCDWSLKTFIQSPSSSFKSLNKEQKRRKILGWIHCLADALAYLHEQDIRKLDIRPRTILVNGDNVYFSDIAVITGLDANFGKIDHVEAERYEYGAPENWARVQQSHSTPSTPVTSTVRARSFFRSISMISGNSNNNNPQDGHISDASEQSASSESVDRVPPTQADEWVSDPSKQFKASTFSLACIFMDLLTFNAKKKTSSFQSHRSSKKSSSRGGGKPDVSFHANLGQVASWIEVLDKEASSKKYGDDRAIKSILQICSNMFYREPDLRPAQRDVADMIWNILRAEGGMPHCGTDPTAPPKEELEEIAFLGRGDPEWEWPWDQRRPSRTRPMTGVSGMEYI
ncbi:hypothetical protein TWF225_007667 [Orbilia oligospora]|uniref:Uncharacterized protein n=1 Tax=Orbilia oligospora TaxID=2813651 RepID=A0A7C8NVP8_ORBOL|nr:hypothetical protein TWF751_001135 [Orbilia oligospora]KAF3179134.1 hypothetical protein TWF225_007667 [Orbilia oligospora]KAF3233482.1 hypothetical protein TWF128_002984 [Orbilia oligospora]KAF3246815.1 hypothetical protein TWF217_009837 [Orbilia oligospora]KAF3296963.1 hypothetical protein TWF132_009453 [Orbilia oligospora]